MSKVAMQGKGGRLGAQGRGALVSRISVLAAGGCGEPFGRYETPLPYEAEKPLHQVHPQVWVSWGLLGYAGAALSEGVHWEVVQEELSTDWSLYAPQL